MKWYYTHLGRQVGPVDQETFQSLVSGGQIKPSTLVWNTAMTDWARYGRIGGDSPTLATEAPSAMATPEAATCAECGAGFSREEMICYEGSWICARCKPIFVQKLREGIRLSGTMEYAEFGIRFGAKFIDWIILMAVNVAIMIALGVLGGTSSDQSHVVTLVAFGNILQIALYAAYNTWFLGRYRATPGKMACHLKVVTAEGDRVSYARALGRHFSEYLSSFILFIGYILAAFDDEKRTLHDRICNTRVVKK